ncbi:MAG: NADH-quinone oxidoreductase subunit F [Anaerolineae bacterium UTCFX2]|nr:NADH-quinone oxidoreductase subunit NuoF [Anaerolineae bacterium]OQY93172.1 MAG: NADH-quinone oxidoreductase subunit F [Anaerolineae bacterium UTCFX2]
MEVKVINKRALVLVSDDSESRRLGSQELLQALRTEIDRCGLANEVDLNTIVDVGAKNLLPLVIIYPEAVVYGPVHPADAGRIVKEHLSQGRVIEEMIVPKHQLTGRIAWLAARSGALPAAQRIVLERAGRIDPESIEDYIIYDGYQALTKALTQMTPAQVIEELTISGLQGRGGAGFPTGKKWEIVASTSGSKKYVICNADESEPGTYKDRVILESDPHSIVEAMALAAYAIGADEGFIYIRGEYQLAQQRFQKAIEQAQALGLLGEHILGTDFSFHLHIHSGAGAYVCGEETALIESIEGKRGEPRSRPPYPTTHGLWGCPTLVNNVETLANVPPILRRSGEWYKKFGTPSSPGTKVYTIFGNVNLTGVFEVPMGITLREAISIYAKGMKNGAAFKLAQTGGSSGSLIPASLQDTPLDFAATRKAGVSLGSGALLIADENTCVVDLVKVLLNFFRFESCGKCTPCRIGTQRSYEILTRITQGQAELDALDELLKLADQMVRLSNCGLGQTAAVPIRDMLKHFRTEVEAHIQLGVCPTGVCPMRVEAPAAEEMQPLASA